jgi:hypothetical protein
VSYGSVSSEARSLADMDVYIVGDRLREAV